jgi:hypothetical protein
VAAGNVGIGDMQGKTVSVCGDCNSNYLMKMAPVATCLRSSRSIVYLVGAPVVRAPSIKEETRKKGKNSTALSMKNFVSVGVYV